MPSFFNSKNRLRYRMLKTIFGYQREGAEIMRVLFIGDIFGKPGKNAVHDLLPEIVEERSPDIVIANGENIAGGFGITMNLTKKLFRYGVDVITTGNHIWDRSDADEIMNSDMNILRPLNFPEGNPGKGSLIFETVSAGKIGVLNSQGRVFMRCIDDPFRTTMREIEKIKEITPNILVDFHAEATSEKKAFGFFVDGKVSAVVGTHTHVQTTDNQVLPKGTAFITDVGMTGAHESVIGVKPELGLQFLLSGRNVRFSPASRDVRLQGVIIDIDKNGTAESIERLDIPIEEE